MAAAAKTTNAPKRKASDAKKSAGSKKQKSSTAEQTVDDFDRRLIDLGKAKETHKIKKAAAKLTISAVKKQINRTIADAVNGPFCQALATADLKQTETKLSDELKSIAEKNRSSGSAADDTKSKPIQVKSAKTCGSCGIKEESLPLFGFFRCDADYPTFAHGFDDQSMADTRSVAETKPVCRLCAAIVLSLAVQRFKMSPKAIRAAGQAFHDEDCRDKTNTDGCGCLFGDTLAFDILKTAYLDRPVLADLDDSDDSAEPQSD